MSGLNVRGQNPHIFQFPNCVFRVVEISMEHVLHGTEAGWIAGAAKTPQAKINSGGSGCNKMLLLCQRPGLIPALIEMRKQGKFPNGSCHVTLKC